MEQAEIITDQAFIFSLLKRLQKKRILLSATVSGHTVSSNTTLLDICTDTPPYLVLDELNNEKTHQQFLDAQSMTVKGRLDGLDLSFTCHLLHTEDSESVAKYYIAFPSSLVYAQQRQSYRIHISPDLQFPVELGVKDDQVMSGHIVDISQTGLGIIFDHYIKFQPGDFINQCNLILPHSETLRCKVIIRHTCYDKASNTTQLGVEMLNMLNQEKREYLRAVANIQREMVRRQARTATH